MPVTIESAGDHVFDLGHIRRQGGEELIRLLLEKAGLDLGLPWRLQVQKKIICNGETAPVRVVGEPKKWAVYLKIKPGDNNSCHYCSLLMPDGIQGPAIYPALKKLEQELDPNWRFRVAKPSSVAQPVPPAPSSDEPAPAGSASADTAAEARPAGPEACAEVPTQTEPSAPAETPAADPPPADPTPPEPAPAERGARGSVRGWLGDAEKTRLFLLALHEINAPGQWYPQDEWVEHLCKRLGWEGVNRYEVGGVLTSFVRKNYIIRRLRGTRPFGYDLTEEGQKLIADLLRPAAAPPVPAPAAPRSGTDAAQIIRSFGAIARRFVEANARLEEIANREADLLTELELLRQERDEICQFLNESEVQSVLGSVARLVRPRG
jgi:hypothetical protein